LLAASAICLLVAGRTGLAATFTVINTTDSGPGSLRQAILNSNAAAGGDLIAFNIPGPGIHTISPLSPLPALTDDAGVTIDGYTQPGSSANTLTVGDNAVLRIELNGAAMGAGAVGLVVQSSGNLLRGLVVNRFDRGIWIQNGSGNAVTGCFIGTDSSGAVPLSNRIGVLLFGLLPEGSPSVRGATIGSSIAASRNVISGNVEGGVFFGFFTSDSVVQGNLIGTNAPGIGAVPNGAGVTTNSASGIRIGGAEPGTGNVISGNTDAGIIVASSLNTVIQGNRVGTTATGTTALPNRIGVE